MYSNFYQKKLKKSYNTDYINALILLKRFNRKWINPFFLYVLKESGEALIFVAN
jgi:hypothetical protein